MAANVRFTQPLFTRAVLLSIRPRRVNRASAQNTMESVGEVPGAASSAPPDVPAQGERLKRAGCMEWVRRKPLSMRSVIVAEELECVSPKRGVFTACDPGVFFVVGVPVISGCGGGCVLRAGWNRVVAPRIGDGGRRRDSHPDAMCPDATGP